jgi:acetyl esterase
MSEHYVRHDVRAFLDYLKAQNGPKLSDMDAPAARTVSRTMSHLADAPISEGVRTRDLTAPGPAGGIPLRLFETDADRDATTIIVYIHGGGWVLGDLDTYAPLCSEIARVLKMPVISVDYRLSPENPWPAAPDDCEAGARWIAGSPAELGRAVDAIVIAGDSAGGNLTIITSLALRDAPAAAPVIAQWPIYPVVDFADRYASYERFNEGYLLDRQALGWFTHSYQADFSHWRALPLQRTQENMPATFVLTAALDPLRDQGRAYAGACIQAGVPTVYQEAAGTIHGFMSLRRALPSSEQDLSEALKTFKLVISQAKDARK